MKLLICIINDSDLLDDVISGLVEVGVKGATILESQGMGKYIAEDMPIFASFKNLVTGSRPFNHTVLSVIDETMLEPAVRVINDICAHDEVENPGILFTLPIEDFAFLPGKDS